MCPSLSKAKYGFFKFKFRREHCSRGVVCGVESETYHLSDIVVEVESEDTHWDEKEDKPHEGDLCEDQEQEEHDQSGSKDNNDGTEGGQVA